MASRLVGIERLGHPLLYQCITVKICSPLLDISAIRKSSRKGLAAGFVFVFSFPRVQIDRRDQELA